MRGGSGVCVCERWVGGAGRGAGVGGGEAVVVGRGGQWVGRRRGGGSGGGGEARWCGALGGFVVSPGGGGGGTTLLMLSLLQKLTNLELPLVASVRWMSIPRNLCMRL